MHAFVDCGERIERASSLYIHIYTNHILLFYYFFLGVARQGRARGGGGDIEYLIIKRSNTVLGDKY